MSVTVVQLSALYVSLAMLAGPAMAQVPGCTSDAPRAGRQILHCNGGFTIELEQGADFHFRNPLGTNAPASAEVHGGAVLISHPTTTRTPPELQILTPQAVASVRGTTFIIDVTYAHTAVFAIDGTVMVARRVASTTIVLHRGDGVDVDEGTGPLQRKHWKPNRVTALLARFGR
jgi:FecR protein